MSDRSWVHLSLKLFGLYWTIVFFQHLVSAPMFLSSLRHSPPEVQVLTTVLLFASQGLIELAAAVFFLAHTERAVAWVMPHSEPSGSSPLAANSPAALESVAFGVAALILFVLALGPFIGLLFPFLRSIHSSNYSLVDVLLGYDQERFIAAFVQLAVALFLFFGRERVIALYYRARSLPIVQPPAESREGDTA